MGMESTPLLTANKIRCLGAMETAHTDTRTPETQPNPIELMLHRAGASSTWRLLDLAPSRTGASSTWRQLDRRCQLDLQPRSGSTTQHRQLDLSPARSSAASSINGPVMPSRAPRFSLFPISRAPATWRSESRKSRNAMVAIRTEVVL